jgi:hypothetical protein
MDFFVMSAGWASPSSRGLWGGAALELGAGYPAKRTSSSRRLYPRASRRRRMVCGVRALPLVQGPSSVSPRAKP